MTTEHQKEIIRKACAAANPEIGELMYYECNNCGEGGDPHYRPIRLADILFSIPKKTRGIMLDASAEQREREEIVNSIIRRWNLRADDLDQQTPSTIAFLANLLTHDN